MNKFFIYIIRFYRYFVSPFTLSRCRYYPSCSEYGLEAYQQYGVFSATYLTLKRLLRCHPWGGSGLDPLPKIESKTRH